MIGATITDRPRGILVGLPSTDEVSKYENQKLNPMLRATDCLARRVFGVDRDPSTGRGKRTISQKDFRNGTLTLTHATSSKGFQMITVGLIVAEEIAEWPADTDGRGHALDQAMERGTQYEGELKVVVPSTPGLAGSCKITELLEKGDERWCFWRCVHCGDHYRLRFSHLTTETTPDGGWRAVVAAPCCGAITYPEDRREMKRTETFVPCFRSETSAPPWARDARGEIIPDVIRAEDFAAAKARDCEGRDKSFHFWRGQASASSWAGVWKKWLEVRDDPTGLRVFYQQYLGEPYEASTETPDTERLLATAGGAPDAKTRPVRRGHIPPWAGVVTIAADTQGTWLEWQAQAHGPQNLSAIIDHGVIDIPPEDPRAWAALAGVFARAWPSAHLRPQVAVRCGVDTGGTATQDAYRFIAGSPVYHGIKAATGPQARFAPPVEVQRRGRLKGRDGRVISKIPLLKPNTHALKKAVTFALHNTLEAHATGDLQSGYHLFLHDGMTLREVEQLTSETLHVDPARDRESWERIGSTPNEQFDMAVYNRALWLYAGIQTWTAESWTALFEREAVRPEDIDMGPLEALMHADPAPAPAPGQRATPRIPAWLRRQGAIGGRGVG